MHCPVCKEPDLEPRELERGLVGAVCQSCEGALLSLIQYRYWVDHHDDKELKPLEEGPIKESENALLCPKCQKMMTKYRLGAGTRHRIDLCGHCDEAWLDKGEWQLLKQLDLHNQLPSVFTEAWQRNIRKQKERQSLEKHYEQEIGEEDFLKVKTFKEWLDKHPKLGQIKHYINIKF